jgi:predicted GNAT family acetyltransferase
MEQNMDMVQTLVGLLPRADLEIELIEAEDESCVYMTRVWKHNGEVVRRDAWISLKQGAGASGVASLN